MKFDGCKESAVPVDRWEEGNGASCTCDRVGVGMINLEKGIGGRSEGRKDVGARGWACDA